ncbi:MAG: hypothetical protein JO301_04710 [Chitinophagaceae bacterium]|nr:hypothetical protein [Chitinophagaceae bacterium]
MNLKHPLKLVTVLLLSALTACEKKADTPVNTPVSRLSKIEYDNNYAEVNYNADGSIASITDKLSNGMPNIAYTFQYSNGNLSEIGFGGKWKYTYTDGKITKVETANETGVVKYQADLAYTGNKLTEKLESFVSLVGLKPYMRTVFTYSAQGNLAKKELFQYINQEWKKSEELQYPEYDNHPNTSEHLERTPYLPLGLYSVNNPLKQVYLDENGAVLGNTVFNYTYDNLGRPLTRTSVEKFIGFPETVETIKLYY